MGSYMMMLYVSLEQEQALKQFFIDKGWKYRKPDPSCFTDELGPITGSVPASSTPVKVKLSSSQSNTPPVHQIPASSRITRSKREHENYKHMDESCMDIGDNYMEGDEDDDYVENDLKEGNQGSDMFLAKLDGTIDDSPDMSKKYVGVKQETQTLMDDTNNSVDTTLDQDFDTLKCDQQIEGEDCLKSTSEMLDRFTTLSSAVTSDKSQDRFACKSCGKSYVKKSSLTRHIMSHKPGGLRCIECNWFFGSQEKLETHNNKYHATPYNCDLCDTSMTRKSSLRMHMLRFHPDKCEARFTCPYSLCKAVFDSQNLFNDHLNSHDGTKPYRCTKCDNAYTSLKALKAHTLTHVQDSKSTQCEDCGKMFQSRGALHNHKMSVHEDKRYNCEVCNKQFMYRTGYTKHLLNHNKDKSWSVKVRDLKMLAMTGDKGVKLTTGVYGKTDQLTVGSEVSNVDTNVNSLVTSSASPILNTSSTLCSNLIAIGTSQTTANCPVVVDPNTIGADGNSQVQVSYLSEPIVWVCQN